MSQGEPTPEDPAQSCIFCKIIKGDIPSTKVYEDTEFVGILDINPATEGHVLLMPKSHYQIMPQMGNELSGRLGIAAKKVSAKILSAFKCDGTTVFIANGFVAGQKAPHFLVHVIPRKDNDGLPLNPKTYELDKPKHNEIRDKLVAKLFGGNPALRNPQNLETKKAETQEADEEPKLALDDNLPEDEKDSKPDLDKISRLFT